MTFAWYAHLKNLSGRPWYVAALVSWGIALFEYLLQVPANRIGYTQLSLPQLKILQEVITLTVFVPFAVFYMNKPLKLDYLWAGLCMLGAVYFVFRSPGTHEEQKNPPEPQTAIHHQVSDAREGREPRVIARLFTGWAVFGERQFVRGYALLLPDPVVPNLNALGAQERIAFLSDMSRLGDALLKVTGAAAHQLCDLRQPGPGAARARDPALPGRAGTATARSTPGPTTGMRPRPSTAPLPGTGRAVLSELTRLGVTKPMRYSPGENAG